MQWSPRTKVPGLQTRSFIELRRAYGYICCYCFVALAWGIRYWPNEPHWTIVSGLLFSYVGICFFLAFVDALISRESGARQQCLGRQMDPRRALHQGLLEDRFAVLSGLLEVWFKRPGTLLVALCLSRLALADPAPEIKVTVLGSVKTPGVVRIRWDDPWPLLRALGKAGGPTECAARDRIHIRRAAGELTVDRFAEVRLQDGDVISVENVRCTVIDSLFPPRSAELTSRTLKGFLGRRYPASRGLVVPRSPDNRLIWKQAKCFDGQAENSIVLDEHDLIVVSTQDLPQPLKARVVGEVRTPGSFSFKADSSVLDLLAVSGGFAPNADLERLTLVRGGNEQSIQDPMALSTIRLLPRDTLRVETLIRINVHVQGEVMSPGDYSVSPKLVDAPGEIIRAAGGLKRTAATHRIVLRRWWPEKSVVFDLDKTPPALQQGDFLIVQSKRCYVYGAVEKPGAVELSGGETLLDILKSCGIKQPNLGKVELTRASDSGTANALPETYDLSQPDLASKVSVGDGDSIQVPSATEKTTEPYVDGANYPRNEPLPHR
jgi:protein involved in polysaccharide export with SLBB domain